MIVILSEAKDLGNTKWVLPRFFTNVQNDIAFFKSLNLYIINFSTTAATPSSSFERVI